MFSAYKALALRDLTPLLAHQSTLEVLNISFLPAGTTAPIWDNLPGFRALKVLIAQEAIPDKATLQKILKLSTLERLTIGQNLSSLTCISHRACPTSSEYCIPVRCRT